MSDAYRITKLLDGHWHGRYGTAPCPVCQPDRKRSQNALTLADGRGKLLAHCKKSECSFRDILAALGMESNIHLCRDAVAESTRQANQQPDLERRAVQARRLWNSAQPVAGTIAEKYLRSRGISCRIPETLRFHHQVWHGPTSKRLPALLGLVEGGNSFALHRTFLHSDGSGKSTICGATKMMLGPTAGGAVQLSSAPGPLVVAEGIETALSLGCGLLDFSGAIWAALSTSGIRRLRLPAEPGILTIASDGDDPGRAARSLAERAYAIGWQVSLFPAPDGLDWNDVLTRKGGGL